MPKIARRLRQRLNASCAAHADTCARPAERVIDTNRRGAPKDEPVVAIARLYREATFCLQPMGDSITRKAMVDAVLLGCIPVFFHAGQRLQWPWHAGGWIDAASLTFATYDNGVRLGNTFVTVGQTLEIKHRVSG